MKLPKIITQLRFPKLSFFKKYGEFFVYGAVLVLLGYLEWRVYGPALRIYQELIWAGVGLEALNFILAIIIAPKARLLAQFFMLSAILFGVIVVYYLVVIV